MKLNYIVSARYDAPPPALTAQMIVNADIGDGDDEFPFSYSPDDPYGLTPYVTKWLLDHPDFVIEPWVDPEA